MAITLGSVEASGANSTAVMSPHVIHYPKPPPDTTGVWIGFGSAVAAYLGSLANRADSTMSGEADVAENKWSALLADPAYGNAWLAQYLKDGYDDLWKLGDTDVEETGSTSLRGLWNNLMINGSPPDYAGVLSRATADVNLINSASAKRLCIDTDRFSKELTKLSTVSINHATVRGALSGVNLVRGAEMDVQQKVLADLRIKAINDAMGVATTHHRLALRFAKEHGNVLSSLMQSYSWLSSAKRSAAQAKGALDASKASANIVAAFAGLSTLFSFTSC